jgi:hypothetical protein
VAYRERLRTPWWWYPIGIFVGLLLGAEFAFIVPDWLLWLPLVISVLAAIGIVWRISSGTIRVSDGSVIAGDRSLPIQRIERIYPLSYAELRRVVGRHGDPLAFNFIRSWVGPGVQLVLHPEPAETAPATAPAADTAADPAADPSELPRLPEPYWLISSRHPDRFIAAIQAAGAAGQS